MSLRQACAKIYVVTPYDKKDLIKEKGGRFDFERKLWYFKDKLPSEFEKYEMMYIDIPYKRKDEMKETYKSLRWDSNEKTWLCSLEDYNIIDL